MAATSSAPTLTLKGKLREMIKRRGECCHKDRTFGYLIDGVSCAGVTQRLAKCFWEPNFNHFKARRRGKGASSREEGVKVHRHIYHQYKCERKGSPGCSCVARFGKKTRCCKAGSTTYNCLVAFREFLRAHQWKVWDCETVVGCPEMHCGTAIDVICVDNLKQPTQVYIVEIKTGYRSCLNQKRTTDGTGMMRGRAGKDIENTLLNHHQLQLWFETHALESLFDIKADQSVVLYLRNDMTYRPIFARDWWFRNAEMRERIYTQFRYGDRLTTSLR